VRTIRGKSCIVFDAVYRGNKVWDLRATTLVSPAGSIYHPKQHMPVQGRVPVSVSDSSLIPSTTRIMLILAAQ